jgi:hypothetical protein
LLQGLLLRRGRRRRDGQQQTTAHPRHPAGDIRDVQYANQLEFVGGLSFRYQRAD